MSVRAEPVRSDAAKGVLVVDDLAFFRRSIAELVRAWGWPVCGEAADGEEAVRQYLLLRPGVVIMDLLMPKMDGYAAIEAIRRADPGAKIVVCSAAGTRDAVGRALKLGVQDFLAKPVDEDRLRRTLERLLGPPSG